VGRILQQALDRKKYGSLNFTQQVFNCGAGVNPEDGQV
jgi:hypothetical protein